MLQIIQSLSSGAVEAADVPAPRARPQGLLIETRASLLSAGTERMLVEFGRAGLLQKARSQPDRVRQVIEKARTDGLFETIDAVRSKLDQPIPLGYCNAGEVLELGPGAHDFKVGDRIVSNGPHAELASVPARLCARIPEGVADEEAAFTPLAAIGLQGVRLVAPSLGETVAVLGLGLVGLLTAQLLRANGCRVIGTDFDPRKLALAQSFGVTTVDLAAGQDALGAISNFSDGRGVDAVLITASSKGDELVSQAAKMCRKRGRIVLVGVTGLKLDRADFYEKELSFQVSCSYGPGRYDPTYEEQGHDYPLGFVRWTEQRNFEAVLDLMASGALDVSPLITHRYDISQASEAYAALVDDSQALGIVLNYPRRPVEAKLERTIQLASAVGARAPSGARIAVLGAGNFASRMLIPALMAAGAELRVLASQGGVSSLVHGRKAGFERATTDVESIFADGTIDAVIVATRHDSHAEMTERALLASKSVFVEKPLALSEDDLERIAIARNSAVGAGKSPLLQIGFNRRFAPLASRMKAMLDTQADPKTLVMTVNAGAIPANHWTQDADAGGGRILGEACHFVDLARFLTGSPITSLKSFRVGRSPADGVRDDKATLVMSFEDGSMATIHYLASGSKAFPKERIEAFVGGRILQLDNFRRLKAWGWPRFSQVSSRMDKGHQACAAAFIRALREGGPPPIPFDELMEVSLWSIRAARFAD